MIKKTIVWLENVLSYFFHAVFDHAAPLSALTLSPDGSRIASAAKDGTVKIWSTISGKNVASFSCPYSARHAAHLLSFSADGCSLAAAFPIKAIVWDVDSASVRNLHFNLFGAFPRIQVFTSDLRTLISPIGSNKIHSIDLISGQETATFNSIFNEPTNVALVSPNGAILACVGFATDKITLFSLANGKLISKFDYPYGAVRNSCLAWIAPRYSP